MIVRSTSNIDLVQGVVGYGDPEGITDWRITNSSGNLNILNSISQTSKLTILENGNVGISNINPVSLLDVSGDVNITGVYKRNNRDVISDTSNYVLSTSNILATRVLTEVGFGSNYTNRLNTAIGTRIDNTSNYVLSASNMLANRVSSQWTNVTTGIHYTPTADQILAYAITSSPVATTIGVTGDYTYQVFTYTSDSSGLTGQTQYTLNVPGGVVCDILIVGGGGGGSGGHGGGGGAGQLVLIKSAVLNGDYTIKVGKGGIGGRSTELSNPYPSTKGTNSLFSSVIAEGGGSSTSVSADKNGGSGAGADGYTQDGGTGGLGLKDTNVDTFASGSVYSRGNNGSDTAPGGGGGAGAAGNGSSGGNGLSGISEINFDFLQSFGQSVGEYISGENKVYFAGGGAGQSNTATGGKGGGGAGGTLGGGIAAPSGLPNTGGGGGGGGAGSGTGGSGGSGIVIIRYLSATKNVGIGITNPATELHVYDDATNNTVVTVQNNYNYTGPSLPTEIVVTGTTGTVIGTIYRTISFPYTTDNTGTGQTQYTFTTTENLSCDILIVAGGGGGGMNAGAGGGAGGLILIENITISTGTYTNYIKVGNGGAGGQVSDVNTVASNGINSVFGSYIAIAGGAGVNSGGANGNAGGSGGGAGNDGSGNRTGGAGTTGQGFKGGNGTIPGGFDRSGGGGGGAGGEGQASVSATRAGDGGVGRNMSSIFGTSVGQSGWFAGGGGGGVHSGTGGTGGTGGGGSENVVGTNGTGGGGGAARSGSGSGRNGGSGIVIIRYRRQTSAALELISRGLLSEVPIPGTTITTVPGTFDRCILFTYTGDSVGLTGQTQYTFTTTETLNCDILVVGGGGGGGNNCAGGGGAGACIVAINQTINAGNYTILVGDGGSGGISNNANGFNGSDSSIGSLYVAKGGGYGAGGGGTYIGGTGGCGGGNSANGGGSLTNSSRSSLNVVNSITNISPSTTSTYSVLGNIGGSTQQLSGTNYFELNGGGGGGIGSVGTNGTTSACGPGGNGIYQVVINSNTYNLKSYFANNGAFGVQDGSTGNYYIGGGGAGGGYNASGGTITISGGLGGGGNGFDSPSILAGTIGTPNTGSGGGGGNGNYGQGGKGGSGIVIIRYRRAIDNKKTYKVGNYGGDFKIISSTSSGDTDFIKITSAGASIYNPTGSPQWSTASDRRIKENIEKASYDKCYDSINKLELYRFNYIKDFNNINKDLRQLGYIAQEVQEIFPKAVSAEQFYNNNLSIPDLLTIDIAQINYSLYGTVKKLIEIDNNKEKRLKKLEYLLNIESASNNILNDTSTSNIVEDVLTSNSIITDTSNVILTDTSTSNIIDDILTSNLVITDTSNVILTDTSTSNLVITDTSTSNLVITDTSTSNIVEDVLTSNSIITDTSNVIITDNSTSNLTQDAS